MFVRDLIEGQSVDIVVLLRARRQQLTLADRSGTIAGVLPDGADHPECPAGAIVRVRGRVVEGRIRVDALRPAGAGERPLDELLDGPAQPVERMEEDLRALVATVRNPHLRRLLDAVFAGDTWEHFRVAPAAKYYHQAYRHGLLEHSLTVAQGVSAMAATFPGIDRDVAVTGALLHDIGKLDAYTADPVAIEMTDLGKLHGEIPLGYYRVRRLIEDIPGFPAETAAAVLHIILSHHGRLEHGSPVKPATREAALVHQIDNLGGTLGSFDRIEKELPDGAAWSSFDRAIGGGAWFGSREAA